MGKFVNPGNGAFAIVASDESYVDKTGLIELQITESVNASQSRILCKRKIVQIKKYMMRPIVIAVGLNCILAHDYLIVKIKMLFRYSVTIVDDQLSVDTTPVLTASCPLFRDVFHSKIQHFE